MALFGNWKGIIGNLFQVGGPAGPQIQNNGGELEARNAANDAYVKMSALDGTADTHVATLLQALSLSRVAIGFGFDGASAPAAGTNTGKYGLCGKTGGASTAGDVIYDTGAVLQLVAITIGQVVTTDVAVSGAGYTKTLLSDCIYTVTAARTFALRGGGGGGVGVMKKIQIALGTSASYATTGLIPDGASISRVSLKVTTGYTAGTTIAITTEGASPLTVMGATDNVATTAGEYQMSEEQLIAATNGGAVTATLSNGGAIAAGAAILTVDYCAVPLT